jgi:arginine exporter protein ArgO
LYTDAYMIRLIPLLLIAIILFVGIFLSGKYYLYERFPNFDALMHVLGAVVLAWIAVQSTQNEYKIMNIYSYTVFIVGVVLILGTIWEVAEYTGGMTKNSYPTIYHYFHGGNLADTLGDLAADMFGAGLFVLSYRWFFHPDS